MAGYEAPKVMRYGSVAALTASDMKCTPGTDQFGYKTPWFARHDPRTTGEQWDQFGPTGQPTGATVDAVTYANWVTSGKCTSLELGPHPITGK